MRVDDESLARHVVSTLSEARLERQAAAIETRTRRPSPSRRRPIVVTMAATAVLGLAAVAGLALRRHGDAAQPATGTTVIEAAAGGETITLPDGSRAVLDARSRLTVTDARADSVAVRLDRGGVDLDVVPRAGKRFVVVAEDYEARVLDARFSLRFVSGSDGRPSLEVKVTQGRVRVARAQKDEKYAKDGDDARVLADGETWSAALVPAAPPPNSTSSETAAPPLAPVVPIRRSGGALLAAKQLLARAETARASNRPRESARLLDTLRARYRSDPRAGLAAFELGRLRLDRLGDPAGAAEALVDAIALAPDAPFREDAQARLVEAREASGDRARCSAARADYLSRYPSGVHREKVALRCAP